LVEAAKAAAVFFVPCTLFAGLALLLSQKKE